jgi:hypothetical protein
MTHHPDTRLPQRVALGVLLRSFPPVQVDRVLETVGRREQRQRLLPARLMVYFTLGMWIFKSLPYELILAELLRDAPGLTLPVVPEEAATAAAIGRARRRLGVEPLRLLFEQAAAPSVPGAARFRELRPLWLCEVEVGVPATPANLLGFGGGLPLLQGPPANAARPARTPLSARLRLLLEGGTGRITGADVADGSQAVAETLPGAVLPADRLLIMDERPLSARLWTAAERFGAEQLWPLVENAQPAHGTRLPDGSVLGKVRADDGSEFLARILGRAGGRPGLLATSILDHRQAPAGELAGLYDRPRPAAPGFDGFDSSGGGGRLELRSKDPEMARQELYAMLCVHHAITDLIGPAW